MVAGSVDTLDLVFDRAPALQAILNAQGILLRANRKFRHVFGGECVGERAVDVIEQASSGLASFVHRLVGKGADFRVDDLLLRARGGDDLRVEAHGETLVAGERYLLALVDQTQRVTAATARAQRERSETIARFAGGLSHDLNNMLSTIISTAQAGAQDLAEGVGDPGRDLRTIVDFAERGASLARSLRSIAFDETGSWRPVDLAEEIRAIAAVLGRGSAGVPIVLDLDDVVAEVVGDRARLHQLVLNLMVNARDATRAHGGGIEVELKRTVSGGVRFSVADAGPGVPPDLRERIFEPYFTTKTEGSHSAEGGLGTGLGLAIVEAVVRSTNGTIEVGTSRTGGALFMVDWPATAVLRMSPAHERPKESFSQPGTVLIADDESALVGAVARQLRRAGHSVYAAMSAQECRRLFGDYSGVLDVVVLDVRLGDGDGRQLAQEFRAARPDLGVVLISASGSRGLGDILPSVQTLSKPFDYKELAQAIDQARRGRRA